MELGDRDHILQLLLKLQWNESCFLPQHLNDCLLENLMKEGILYAEESDVLPSLFRYMSYIYPVLLVIGTSGNVLAFLVIMLGHLKKPTFKYLAALAIVDLCVLYLGLVPQWMTEVFHVDISVYSPWLCKFLVYLSYVSSDFSAWLTVIVTAERFVAVCKPMQVSMICKVKRTWPYIACGIVVLCLINGHLFWTVSVYIHDGRKECSAVQPFAPFIHDIWPWIDASLYTFIPSSIIVVLDILMIRSFVMEKNIIGRYTSAKLRRNGQSNRLLIMLFAVSILFVLLTLPLPALLIAAHFDKHTEGQRFGHSSDFLLANRIVELLMYLHHSVNFFLYCATGKKFRSSVKRVFGKLFCCTRNHHHHHQTNIQKQIHIEED